MNRPPASDAALRTSPEQLGVISVVLTPSFLNQLSTDAVATSIPPRDHCVITQQTLLGGRGCLPRPLVCCLFIAQLAHGRLKLGLMVFLFFLEPQNERFCLPHCSQFG